MSRRAPKKSHGITIPSCWGEDDESVLQLLDSLEVDVRPEFEGVVWLDGDMLHFTGIAASSHDIDTIPDRGLLYR